MPGSSERATILIVAARFLAFMVVIGALGYFVFDVELGTISRSFVLIGTLFLLGFARLALPKLGQIIDIGYYYYVFFTVLLIACFAPGILFYLVANWLSGSQGDVVNAIFFVLSGVFWLLLVIVVFPIATRRRLIKLLAEFGWMTPLIFLVNYIFVSLVFFGFLSFYLFGPEVADKDGFLNLFGYHLLDSIPGLKIADTLNLTEPLAERGIWLGVMILLFKFAVLVPGIAAFRAYWTDSQVAAARSASDAKR